MKDQIIDKKVVIFYREMQKQLDFNEPFKGDWRNYKDVKSILVDLEYHKSKLYLAIKEKNNDALREYIADCANILLFLGNSFDLYDEFKDDDIIHEMASGIFFKKASDKAIIKKLI